jgi:hypothetical protein
MTQRPLHLTRQRATRWLCAGVLVFSAGCSGSSATSSPSPSTESDTPEVTSEGPTAPDGGSAPSPADVPTFQADGSAPLAELFQPVTLDTPPSATFVRIDPETETLVESDEEVPGPSTFGEVVDRGVAAGLWDEIDGLTRVIGHAVGALPADRAPGVDAVLSGALSGVLERANRYPLSGEYSDDQLSSLRRVYELAVPTPEALALLESTARSASTQASGFAAPRVAAGCSGVSADDFDDWGVIEGCYKVYEDIVDGKTLKVYYPDWYEQVPDRAEMPLLAREALVESMTVYASFADIGDVNLIFSLIDTIDSDGTLAVATSDSQWGLASIAGACPITIFPLSFSGADRFKQTVAHELWHCVQRENGYPAGSGSGTAWIVEGGAEFMSNVVYPSVNDEWTWVDNFDRQSTTTAIFDIDYPAWLWWQYVGSQQGPAAVVTLMQSMIDAGDGGKAIMAASYGPDFQRFIVDFMAGAIPDSGGNVPRGERFIGGYRKVVNNDDGKTLDFEVAPFVGARWVIEYDKQLRVTEVDRTSTVGELAMTRWADRGDPAAWKQVAPEVRSKCENKEYYMLAATTHQGTHQPKIEILETEQAVCDPCLLGTWDLRLDTFKGMILAAGGDLPAGADFSFGGNYYLEFDDLGDFKEQRAALGIIASFEGNSITFTIDSFATGRYTADGENISILDIVEQYVNVTSPFGGPGFSDSNVFAPGGGGTYVCDDDVLTVTVTGFPPISWDRVDKILQPDNTIPA